VGLIATSASMEPTVHCAQHDGPDCRATSADLLLVARSGSRNIRRGDLILFRAPTSSNLSCSPGSREIVKRVIGLGGDEISESAGRIFVDGKRLNEPYVLPSQRDHVSGRWRVPPRSFFVMGDNRRLSCDSRYWGAVIKSAVDGRVTSIIRRGKGGSDSLGPPVVHVRFEEVLEEIASPAMEPTLRCSRRLGQPACTGRANDRVLVSLSGARSIRRQDLIEFRTPLGAPQGCGTRGAIERVIGIGGDRVLEQAGRIRVNGKLLEEAYIPARERDHHSGNWSVPRGSLFVLADYRSRACDSRIFGPVPLSSVRGRVVEVMRMR
jgi:signal peptidase I